MQITKEQLKQIIKEELQSVLREEEPVEDVNAQEWIEAALLEPYASDSGSGRSGSGRLTDPNVRLETTRAEQILQNPEEETDQKVDLMNAAAEQGISEEDFDEAWRWALESALDQTAIPRG